MSTITIKGVNRSPLALHTAHSTRDVLLGNLPIIVNREVIFNNYADRLVKRLIKKSVILLDLHQSGATVVTG
jgi:hypothetical protein